MSAVATASAASPEVDDHYWRRAFRRPGVLVGGSILAIMWLGCLLTLPWTMHSASAFYYNAQHQGAALQPPRISPGWQLLGSTKLGQSLFGQCLAGGAISLAIGIAAAAVSVILGVTVGMLAGYLGGWVDGLLMRLVDVLYALPYMLMVILIKIALEGPLSRAIGALPANLVVLFLAIGLVSWLTMARVIRGQVLSLRSQPFIEAARALGVPRTRIFMQHLLPNLIGPITVYATLTVPQAILQESMLSFLGIGIQKPLPTWGSLASDGMLSLISGHWWLLVFPCTLLAVTLLSLNFVGDGLRDALDPQSRRNTGLGRSSR